jgi:hypothetical protein
MTKTIKFFYPYLHNESPIKGQELVWSINSVRKFATDFTPTFIVIGDRLPAQLANDTDIKFVAWLDSERKAQPSEDVLYKMIKLMKVLGTDSEPIVLMNDDFIINSPIDSSIIHNFYFDGTLQERWLAGTKISSQNFYSKKLLDTKEYLDSFALPTLNYGVHFPVPIYPVVMHHVLKLLNNTIHNVKEYGTRFQLNTILIRSLYCNYFKKYHQQLISKENQAQIVFTKKSDKKLRVKADISKFKQTIEGEIMFSICDEIITKDIINYLNRMFDVRPN